MRITSSYWIISIVHLLSEREAARRLLGLLQMNCGYTEDLVKPWYFYLLPIIRRSKSSLKKSINIAVLGYALKRSSRQPALGTCCLWSNTILTVCYSLLAYIYIEIKYSRMFHPMPVILSGSIDILGYYSIWIKLSRCVGSRVQAEWLIAVRPV